MVFEIFYGTLDVIFAPIVVLKPIYAIFVIACIVSFISTLAYKLLVNQERLEYLKKEIQDFQQEMMKARKKGDPKDLEKLQKKQMEFMSLQKEMMTMSFKPMIVTFIPIIIIFAWLAHYYQNAVVAKLPNFIHTILLVDLWHWFYGGGLPENTIGWLGWYILCSFAMSIIFRKYMGIKGGM